MPTVTSNGVTSYYEDGGHGDKTVLFIPGGGATIESWAGYREAFEARARVIVVENRGVGRSPHNGEPWTVADMAADTVAVLADAGVDRATVVGLSLGGAIAQELTLLRPDLVERLVLISCVAQTGPEAGPFMRPLWDLMDDLEEHGFRSHRALAMVLAMCSRDTLADDNRARQIHQIAAQVQHPAQQIVAMRSFNSLDRLGNISCPTTVLVGADDIHTTPKQAGLIADRIPGARLEVVPNAGHLMHQEKRAELLELLLGTVFEPSAI